MILEYKGYNLLYADPTIIAALASPPYYKDLEFLDGGDNYVYNSSTTIGQSSGSGGGTTQSSTISVGAYVAAEMEIKVPFGKAVIESEIAYNHGWIKEAEEIEIRETTVEYTTLGGQDSVVLITLPMDVYQYNLYYPVDDKGSAYDVMGYEVVIPYEVVQTIVSLDTYSEIAADYPDILPDIDRDIFKHTVGYPGTYISSAAGLPGAYASGTYGAPEGSSSISHQLSITTEKSSSTLSSNSVDIKAGGGGFDIGIVDAKVTVGVTAGYEDTRGKIQVETAGTTYSGTIGGLPKAAGSMGYYYTWQLIQYKYSGIQQFPVITYAVPMERSPAVLPDNYWVDGTTTNSVTLCWTPSAEDNLSETQPNIEYTVYRINNPGTGYASYSARTEEIVYDYAPSDTEEKNGKVYQFTEESLAAKRQYVYVITARRVSDPNKSVYSDVMVANTKANQDDKFTAHPTSVKLYPDEPESLHAQFHRESADKVTYSWERLDGKNWVALTAADGVTGFASDTLSFPTPTGGHAGEYRLLASAEYEGEIIPIYSNTCTVTFSKRSSVVSLSTPGVIGDSVTVTAQVTNNDAGSAVPTGTVTFNITNSTGYEAKPTATVDSEGKAILSLPISQAGVFTVNAKYNGDSVFAAGSVMMPVSFIKGMDQVTVPVLTTTFTGGSFVYGNTAPLPVTRYSSTETGGVVITATAEYAIGKWNGKSYDTVKVSDWVTAGALSFRDTGSYLLTITDKSSPNAIPLSMQFTVSPRPVAFEIGNIYEQKPEFAEAGDLSIALTSGDLVVGDTLSELGYVKGNLAAYTSDGTDTQVTLDGNLPAGTYKIKLTHPCNPKSSPCTQSQ